MTLTNFTSFINLRTENKEDNWPSNWHIFFYSTPWKCMKWELHAKIFLNFIWLKFIHSWNIYTVITCSNSLAHLVLSTYSIAVYYLSYINNYCFTSLFFYYSTYKRNIPSNSMLFMNFFFLSFLFITGAITHRIKCSNGIKRCSIDKPSQ